MKKQITLALGLLSLLAIISAKSAFADGISCQPIYGGGQSCVQSGNVSVNKRVVDPVTNNLVDNLGINDNKFGPEGVVTFQISVTNTGNSQIGTVQIRDIFPQYVDFVSGMGNFDSNSRVLAFDITNLNAGETRSFNIIGKVVKSENLPVDKGIVCVINQATAKDASASNQSQDNAQMCIQKSLVTTVPTETKGGLKVFPPQKVLTAPATGPEMLPLIALLPTGAFGMFLRKKAVK